MATTVFLAHQDNSMVAAGTLTLLIQGDASLKPEGNAVHTTITVFLTYLGSMVALSCFSALMLLVGQQEGHSAFKVLQQQLPKVCFWGPT